MKFLWSSLRPFFYIFGAEKVIFDTRLLQKWIKAFRKPDVWEGGREGGEGGLVVEKCLTVCLWRWVWRRLCGGVWAWGLEERLGQVLLGQGLQVVPLGETVQVWRGHWRPWASHSSQVRISQGVPCRPLEIEGAGVQQRELADLNRKLSGDERWDDRLVVGF